MATKPGSQPQRERPVKLRQAIQSKITDHPPMPSMAATCSTEANKMEVSRGMDMSELVREVTDNISVVMEQKLSKLTDTLDKIANTLESQAKRITEAEQRVSTVEDQVASLELRLIQVENKQVTMVEQIDDAENRSRRDNIRILNLKEGTEGDHPLEFFESWLPTLLGLSAAKGCLWAMPLERVSSILKGNESYFDKLWAPFLNRLPGDVADLIRRGRCNVDWRPPCSSVST